MCISVIGKVSIVHWLCYEIRCFDPAMHGRQGMVKASDNVRVPLLPEIRPVSHVCYTIEHLRGRQDRIYMSAPA